MKRYITSVGKMTFYIILPRMIKNKNHNPSQVVLRRLLQMLTSRESPLHRPSRIQTKSRFYSGLFKETLL